MARRSRSVASSSGASALIPLLQANVLWSLAWAAAIFFVFLPLAARGWRTLE